MPAVRVIGWTPLADPVEAALRAAGATTHPQSIPPEQVIRAQVEPGTVDLVVVERDRELLIARLLRRRAPERPLVLVGTAKVEAALRHAVRTPGGADGYVTWPADGTALVEGIARAQTQVGRSRPDRGLWERTQDALVRWRFAVVLLGLLAGLPRYQDPRARRLALLASAAAWMLFGLTGFWKSRAAIRPWVDRLLGTIVLGLGAVLLLQALGVIPGLRW
jgi:hypothetical protein